MQLIDSHTHLYLPEFDDDRDEVIERAIDRGVTKMLLPNIDKDSVEPMLQLTVDYPGICFPMIGAHPTSIKDDYKEHLKAIHDNIKRYKFIAIGEIGIDLYRDKTYIREQKEAFTEQLRIAGREKLPVVIHTRESHDIILRLLDDAGIPDLRGVFHAFTGDHGQAREIIERGFLIGIGGILTFRNSSLDKTLEMIDMEHIILETDSPFLAPVPKRGKRNESSYIRYIAEKLSEIKKLPLEEIAGISTSNCNNLFKLY
ncbi:MAG TPA: TatD family deoxyribonuclease [Bacteroidetes bacterium]|nr:TatD family deoxyribonuclease [Bacteroidota bacterium]